MSIMEEELEARLGALPDAHPDFTRITMYLLRRHGLVETTLQMLRSTPNATANDVTKFECEYRGVVELYDGDGQRVLAETGRLALTREMRGILADLKGKTFKTYECVAPGGGAADRSDGVVGIALGQHAVHIFSRDFPFVVLGARTELSALHCELKSLRDDYGLPPDVPVRTHAVGERATGVELVTDHAEVLRDRDADVLDVDVAVVVRTAHAAYTFARESWRSTGIRVAMADRIAVPYEPSEVDAARLGLPEGSGITVGEVSRTVEKLA